MKRFIDQGLRKWKKARRRKPLIVRGARQVGKTYSVRQFGKDCFDALAIVNLERNPDWHRIFEGIYTQNVSVRIWKSCCNRR